MRRSPEANLSIDGVDKSEAESLRALLERTEPADLFDKRAGERVGRFLAHAALSAPNQNGPATGLLLVRQSYEDSAAGQLRERRADVIRSAKDEAKRRRLGIHGN
jgi:hypothetical protein